MTPYDTETREIRGYSVTVESYVDEHMGPPWEEHDGHGDVSKWTTRDKLPGELVLSSDRSSKRYYDFAGAVKKARAEGWGVSDGKGNARVFATKGEQAHAAALADYEHLKAWCDDEWHWTGYTTTITGPDGREHDGDSCWGFDDNEYMLSEAWDNAESPVDDLIELEEQTQLAACFP